jgi:hypothetical protein
MATKISISANIHLHVTDLLWGEIEALKQDLQVFLNTEERAQLLSFTVTETQEPEDPQ